MAGGHAHVNQYTWRSHATILIFVAMAMTTPSVHWSLHKEVVGNAVIS